MGGSCPKLHCRLLSTFPSFPPPGQSLPFPDQQRTTPHPTLGGASRPRHPAPWAPALARGTEHGESPIGRAPKSRNCFRISGKWFCLCERGNRILSPADCPATNPCSPLAASEFELLGEKSEAHDGLQVQPSQAGCALGRPVPLRSALPWKSSHSFTPDAIPRNRLWCSHWSGVLGPQFHTPP